MVVMTVATNYVFMRVFEWGLLGAAVATGLTGLWNMGWRTAMMWRIFKIHPFSKGWFTVAGIALLVGANPLVSDAPDVALELGAFGQVVMAVLRGGLAAGTVLVGSWLAGALPELSHEVRKRLTP